MLKFKVKNTPFKGVKIIIPLPYSDIRGFIYGLFCNKTFQKFADVSISHINYSSCKKKGTLRGLHYQIPPYIESKYVTCINGGIFDVIVDVRKNSKTFLKWFGVNLTADNKHIIFIPKGFAHGFQALKNNTIVVYSSTSTYKPEYERGINYQDELINIQWKLPVKIISNKDNNLPMISKKTYFYSFGDI